MEKAATKPLQVKRTRVLGMVGFRDNERKKRRQQRQGKSTEKTEKSVKQGSYERRPSVELLPEVPSGRN